MILPWQTSSYFLTGYLKFVKRSKKIRKDLRGAIKNIAGTDNAADKENLEKALSMAAE